jgi:hypothetical protein
MLNIDDSQCFQGAKGLVDCDDADLKLVSPLLHRGEPISWVETIVLDVLLDASQTVLREGYTRRLGVADHQMMLTVSGSYGGRVIRSCGHMITTGQHITAPTGSQ